MEQETSALRDVGDTVNGAFEVADLVGSVIDIVELTVEIVGGVLELFS